MRTVPQGRREQLNNDLIAGLTGEGKVPPSAASSPEAPVGSSRTDQARHGPRHPDSQPFSERSRIRELTTPSQRPAEAQPSPLMLEVRDMKDRFAMGDFSGALEAAEGVLAKRPEELEAKSMAAKCRDVLYDMYASRIADFEQTVRVIMGPDQIRWLSLDHRAGFLLSMIDGTSTVNDLLDVCGMPKLDAMRILCNLLDQKVVALR